MFFLRWCWRIAIYLLLVQLSLLISASEVIRCKGLFYYSYVARDGKQTYRLLPDHASAIELVFGDEAKIRDADEESITAENTGDPIMSMVDSTGTMELRRIAVLRTLRRSLRQGKAGNPASSSAINCIGAWSNCTTVGGELNCKVRFGINPFQPTVCRVTNACIAGNELELYAESPQTRAFHGEELAMSPFAAKVHKGDAGNVRIKVRPANEAPPATDPVLDPVTAVLVENVENHNVGHVYGDEVWPAFQMIHRYNFDWRNKQFRLVLRKKQELHKSKVHELVSDHVPLHMQGQQRQCFKELFVGSNAMSYSESSPDPHALSSFRDFLLHRAHKKWDINLQSSAGGFSDRTDPNILVVLKDVEHSAHPTLVTNYEAAVETLKQQFPSYKITMLKWHGKSQKQQVQIMQNTDILYSQPGSDVMNALFMPAGSSLLTPCRALDANWLVSSKTTQKPPSKVLIEYGNEIRIWFNAMPDMRCMQVCGEEDISFEKNKFMVPATINVTNLVKTIQVVIDDWQQRRQSRLLEQA